MPIKPENRSLYPSNWKEIRQDILKRANNKCEFCGIENYKIKDNGAKVVLTIAHLDQDPTNNDYTNLRALCQKCHNKLDMPYRVQHRKENAKIKCCLCLKEITFKDSHDIRPIISNYGERCCKECNENIVIPTRQKIWEYTGE